MSQFPRRIIRLSNSALHVRAAQDQACSISFFYFDSERSDRKRSIQGNEDGVTKRRFTVVLDKFEHLPSILAITQLLQPPPPAYSQTKSDSSQRPGNQGETHFDALRLMELADRPPDVMVFRHGFPL